MTRKSFVRGTVILTVSGLIVRLSGFFYRIYLSNLIGAEGMGLFQLIAPVYSLVILTLTAGISIAVSKLVAQEHAKGNLTNSRRITQTALVIVTMTGILVSLLMYINLGAIVDIFIKDRRTYQAMVFLLPCIPIIAASSAVKGYFYGIQNMMPTAVSQVVEQAVRIVVVLISAEYYVRAGIEYACALATAGMALGEISSLLLLAGFYWVKNKKGALPQAQTRSTYSKRRISYMLLKIAVPVSSNRFVSSIMSTVEYILIPRMLLAGGLDYKSSIEVYGRMTGMAMPLIFFPTIITSSLATTLVPSITEAMSLRHYRAANGRIAKAIQFSSVLGFLFAGIFFAYSRNISDIVYKNEDIGKILFQLSFTCVFIYLHQTLLGIMNGLDRQTITLRNSLAGNILRIAAVVFLVPHYGIESYIAAIATSLVFVSALDLLDVSATSGLSIDIRKWFLKPAAGCFLIAVTGRFILHFYDILNIAYAIKVILSIGTSLVFGLVIMSILGVLNAEKVIDFLSSKNMKAEEISRIFL